MKLTIENLPYIKKADIHLDGLTVVACESWAALADFMSVVCIILDEVAAPLRRKEPSDVERILGYKLRKIFDFPRDALTSGGRIRILAGEFVLFDASVEDYYVVKVNVWERLYFNPIAFNKQADVLRWVGSRRNFPIKQFPVFAFGGGVEGCRHPKEQLLLAKDIVESLKNLDSILLTSNSPYMVGALKRYSDREGRSARFGMAGRDGVLRYDCLSDIFAGFSEPFDEFRRMDAEDMREE